MGEQAHAEHAHEDGDAGVQHPPRARAGEDAAQQARAEAEAEEPQHAGHERPGEEPPPVVAEAVGDGAEHEDGVEVEVRVEPGQRQREQDGPTGGEGAALAGVERGRAPRAHGGVQAEGDQVEPAEDLGDRQHRRPALEHDAEAGHAGGDGDDVGDQAGQHDGQDLLAADPLAEQERVLCADGDDESESGEQTGESNLEHAINGRCRMCFNPANYFH